MVPTGGGGGTAQRNYAKITLGSDGGPHGDVKRTCSECDSALLKTRRGRREPLHQYVVGVLMERLAMDVAGRYPVTSSGNQYCLMVGRYFSKWLECFPISDQKATTFAGKLVFEVVTW